MSDAARRKERKRLKREKKKAQMRRATAGSPYKRIGQIGEIEACYINADWQTSGMATIHLIRQNPRGGLALACFLIDLWCAGLKDAWGAIDMTSGETDEHIERAGERFELVRIEPDAARHLIAGGIRFARQNGFRLPPHFDRWVNVLGELPEPATADLRPFGKDGGLLWIGPLGDLRRRLIGCSAEEFLARPHVHFISEIEDPGEFEPDEEDFDEEFDGDDEEFNEDVERVLQEATELCGKQGEEPSPLMLEAVKAIMLAARLRAAEEDEDPAVRESVLSLKEAIKSNPEPDCSENLEEAIAQIFRLMPHGPSSLEADIPRAEST